MLIFYALDNFREYLAIYPEYSCIFVGDNGQGDVRTAELVLSDEEFGKNLQRVYVHQVYIRFCNLLISTHLQYTV